MIRKTGLLCVPLLMTLGLAACDVDQTDEGEMPDVDVQVEGGDMPGYEVETADIEVKENEETIEVPEVDVRTEEKEITVPDVDVEMPDEGEGEQPR